MADIDVVSQRDVLDLNAKLLALAPFFLAIRVWSSSRPLSQAPCAIWPISSSSLMPVSSFALIPLSFLPSVRRQT